MDPPTTKEARPNSAKTMVDTAAAKGYAILAVACYTVEAIIATVRAAEAQRSPALILLFPWAIEYAGGLLVHAAAEAAVQARVPVAVHMDHAQDPNMVRRAVEIGGFDGMMVDMSHFDRAENLARTRELVAFCQTRGLVTEAESGRIDGGEDGVADPSAAQMEAVLTTEEEAEEFVALGIDWLAPAFGNVHGAYGPQGPQLDFARLQGIHAKVGNRVRLVLHGTHEDWFGKELLRKCIAHGISKVNVNGAVAAAYTRVAKESMGTKPLTAVVEEQTKAMQDVIEEYMMWVMSSGKARMEE